jgi:TolA-binding protein
MKPRLIVISSLALIFLLLGCGSQQAAPPEPVASAQTEAGQESETPTEAEEPMTPEEREGYIKKVEAELKQMDDRIVELKEQSKKTSGATRDKLNGAIKELEEKRKAAQEKLARLKDATAATSAEGWDATKKGADKAVNELKKTYNRVKDLF